MEWLSNKLDNLLTWIRNAIIQVWTAVKEFFYDLFVSAWDGVLDAVATIFESVPVPDFLGGGGLQGFLNGIHPAVLYFLDRSQFGPALLLLGAGVTFRLLRKAFTLGQW